VVPEQCLGSYAKADLALSVRFNFRVRLSELVNWLSKETKNTLIHSAITRTLYLCTVDATPVKMEL